MKIQGTPDFRLSLNSTGPICSSISIFSRWFPSRYPDKQSKRVSHPPQLPTRLWLVSLGLPLAQRPILGAERDELSRLVRSIHTATCDVKGGSHAAGRSRQVRLGKARLQRKRSEENPTMVCWKRIQFCPANVSVGSRVVPFARSMSL